MRFKIWIENVFMEEGQPLDRKQRAEIKKLYDKVFDVLGLSGAQDKQLNLSLSDIEEKHTRPGRPPMRGAQVVKDKLDNSGVYQALDKFPSLMARSRQVQDYLQKLANDQRVGPKDTIGQLLNKLFGDNAVEMYGKGLYKSAPVPTNHAPQNNMPVTPDATSPPMGDQQPPTPGNDPVPNGAPPMPDAQPPEGAPPMPPGPPPGPMPGAPPMPPDPKQPLKSPGGPMPPMPPGGMF